MNVKKRYDQVINEWTMNKKHLPLLILSFFESAIYQLLLIGNNSQESNQPNITRKSKGRSFRAGFRGRVK